MQYTIQGPLVLYSACQRYWSQDTSWEKELKKKKSDEYLTCIYDEDLYASNGFSFTAQLNLKNSKLLIHEMDCLHTAVSRRPCEMWKVC